MKAKFRCKNYKDNGKGNALTPEDFAAGRQINAKDFAPLLGSDPIQLSGYFEGDIKDPPTLQQGKNAVRDPRRKWPDGVIPYELAKIYNPSERARIARAMEEYQNRTCIRFQPRSNEKDYLHIMKKKGCFSNVGRVGDAQILSLGDNCLQVGVIIHEMMHALGFWHEQSRSDRDEFVTVKWENIKEGRAINFKRYTDGRLDHLGEPYDYGSIMHYGKYAFAKDRNLPTIVPKQQHVVIGQRRDFSEIDLRKVNKLYECQSFLQEGSKGADSDKRCRGWAERGECKKNPKWMLVNCRQACNQHNRKGFRGT